jgi:hypothetical protein
VNEKSALALTGWTMAKEEKAAITVVLPFIHIFHISQNGPGEVEKWLITSGPRKADSVMQPQRQNVCCAALHSR